MQWYYLDPDQQQIPATEEELAVHVQGGVITGETLLWNETMSDWQGAAALFPAWFPAAQVEQPPASAAAPVVTRARPRLAVGKSPTVGLVKRSFRGGSTVSTRAGQPMEPEEAADKQQLIKACASSLGANAKWMKFLGVLHIIGGVLACLSISGLIIGWLPIWLGVILMKSSAAIQVAEATGKQADLNHALDRVGFYFKVRGIYTLTVFIMAIVSVVLVFVFMGAIMAWAASQTGGMMPPGMESIPLEPPPFEQPPLE